MLGVEGCGFQSLEAIFLSLPTSYGIYFAFCYISHTWSLKAL